VPAPFSNPTTLDVIVITGVVDALATVPPKPFADATETDVTVPDAGNAPQEMELPSVVKYLPELPD
jgi:hypothetical protein